MLEKTIEGAFGSRITDWAIEENINLAYVKFTGAKGWPDRILTWGLGPDKPPHFIWIEWKRPGEKLRPLQAHIHKILRSMGHDVRVYDDYRLALDELREEIRATLRADSWDEADCLKWRDKVVSSSGKGED